MTVAIHLKIVGVLLIILALFHVTFPNRFAWKQEFVDLSLFNRQMAYVHCGFIGLMVLMQGILALFFTDLLLERTALAKPVLAGVAVFWFARLLVQFFVYSPALWRGDRFNTAMHVVFSVLWTYFTVVFAWAFALQLH